MRSSRGLRVGLFLFMGAALFGAVAAGPSLAPTPSVAAAGVRAAAAAQLGQWVLVHPNVPIRTPIHAALLRTGKVLLAAGSGNDRTQAANHVYQTALWDPATGVYTN